MLGSSPANISARPCFPCVFFRPAGLLGVLFALWTRPPVSWPITKLKTSVNITSEEGIFMMLLAMALSGEVLMLAFYLKVLIVHDWLKPCICQSHFISLFLQIIIFHHNAVDISTVWLSSPNCVYWSVQQGCTAVHWGMVRVRDSHQTDSSIWDERATQ